MPIFPALLLFCFCLGFPLHAQEETAPPLLLYPLAVSPTAEVGFEWPPSIPFDSFRTEKGSVRAIALELEDSMLRLDRDKAGKLTAYPFLFMDAPANVRIAARTSERSLSLLVETEPPMELSYTYGDEGYPLAAQSMGEGDPLVAVFSYSGEIKLKGTVAETQFDLLGTVVGYAEYAYLGGLLRSQRIWTAEGALGSEILWDYDAHDRITRIVSPEGETEVRYDQNGRVHSVKRGAEERELQWDERNLLVREWGLSADGQAYDHRHAYALDARGNWTERRTTAMVKRFGVLVPEAGLSVRRTIAYWE
jgi:YD repeat-containing protein